MPFFANEIGPEPKNPLPYILAVSGCLLAGLGLVGYLEVIELLRGGRAMVLCAVAGVFGLLVVINSSHNRRHIAWTLTGLAAMGVGIAVLVLRYIV